MPAQRFLFLCGLYTFILVRKSGADITCEAPSVYPGEPANITCHFDVDVSRSKDMFFVQRIDVNGKFSDIQTASKSREGNSTTKNEGAETGTNVGLVVGLLIAIIIVVVIVAVIVILKRKKKIPRWCWVRKRRTPDTEDHPETGGKSSSETCDGGQMIAKPTSYDSNVEDETVTPLLANPKPENENKPLDVSRIEVKGPNKVQANHKKELFLACQTGDEKKLKKVNLREHIHSTNSEGETPLHVASRYGHANLAEELLSKGANINIRDNKQWTPLHTASYTGALEVVDVLLQKGAQVGQKAKDGSTPLHLACKAETGHVSIRSPSTQLLSDSSVKYTAVSTNDAPVESPSWIEPRSPGEPLVGATETGKADALNVVKHAVNASSAATGKHDQGTNTVYAGYKKLEGEEFFGFLYPSFLISESRI